MGKTSNPPMGQTMKNRMSDNLRKKPNLTEEIVPEVTVSRKYLAGQALDKDLSPLNGNPENW